MAIFNVEIIETLSRVVGSNEKYMVVDLRDIILKCSLEEYKCIENK